MNRRRFLKEAATVASAATVAGTIGNRAAAAPQAPAGPASVPPSPVPDQDPPAEAEVLTLERSVADDMVDVIKSLGLEYITTNPGSSFRGLHESLINYGRNEKPELLTCCHEESSVAMAHGFAKIAGRPIGVLAHGTVGLQHAAMAVYNAYCDRVPVVILVGNTLDATARRPGVEWAHSVQDAAAMVRDYSKWDDLPVSIDHFAESAVRAYKLALTPPMGPVLLVIDSELQEKAAPALEAFESRGSPYRRRPRPRPGPSPRRRGSWSRPSGPSSSRIARPARRRGLVRSSSSPKRCRPAWSIRPAG